jgi:hypothetical protein
MRAKENVKVIRRLMSAYAASTSYWPMTLCSTFLVANRSPVPMSARPRSSATWGR